MILDWRAIYVIYLREFKKFLRERSRLAGTLIRPMLWLLVIGGGLSGIIIGQGEITYMQFIFPGMLGMTILFASIFSTISIVWDREFGFLREILVAPISRLSIVFGKALSGTVLSTIQVMMILLLFPFIGLKLTFSQILITILISIPVSFGITSLGIFIASLLESFESFNVVMNFIIMPMFFLSGAMYPVNLLPPVLKMAALINPLTYGIDAMRNIMFAKIPPPLSADFPLTVDLAVVFLTCVVTIVLAAKSFERIR